MAYVIPSLSLITNQELGQISVGSARDIQNVKKPRLETGLGFFPITIPSWIPDGDEYITDTSQYSNYFIPNARFVRRCMQDICDSSFNNHIVFVHKEDIPKSSMGKPFRQYDFNPGQQSPYRYSVMSVPLLNYWFYSITKDMSAGERVKTVPRDLLDEIAFDGVVLNEAGGDTSPEISNVWNTPQRSNGERLINSTVRGRCMVHNIWGSQVDAYSILYIIIKKVTVPSYFKTRSDLPEKRVDPAHTGMKIFQAVPWVGWKNTPSLKDLAYVDEDGITKYGVAIKIARSCVKGSKLGLDKIAEATYNIGSATALGMIEVLII